MKYKLDNSSQQEVLDQITKLDISLEDVNIQVKIIFYLDIQISTEYIFTTYMLQTCTDILNALVNGEFGEVGNVAEEYRKTCYKRFPLATAFHTDQDRSPMAFWSNSYKTLNETHENCVSN